MPSPNSHLDDRGSEMVMMNPLGVLLSEGNVIYFPFEFLWGPLSEVHDISEGLPLRFSGIPLHGFITCAS